jgi:hypothetical protein
MEYYHLQRISSGVELIAGLQFIQIIILCLIVYICMRRK